MGMNWKGRGWEMERTWMGKGSEPTAWWLPKPSSTGDWRRTGPIVGRGDDGSAGRSQSLVWPAVMKTAMETSRGNDDPQTWVIKPE